MALGLPGPALRTCYCGWLSHLRNAQRAIKLAGGARILEAHVSRALEVQGNVDKWKTYWIKYALFLRGWGVVLGWRFGCWTLTSSSFLLGCVAALVVHIHSDVVGGSSRVRS